MRTGKLRGLLLYAALLLLACWVCYAMVWGKGGLVRRREAAAELASLEAEIIQLEREIERTNVHLRNLRSNQRYLLGYARELGYRRPDEVIFKFIKKRPPTGADKPGAR